MTWGSASSAEKYAVQFGSARGFVARCVWRADTCCGLPWQQLLGSPAGWELWNRIISIESWASEVVKLILSLVEIGIDGSGLKGVYRFCFQKQEACESWLEAEGLGGGPKLLFEVHDGKPSEDEARNEQRGWDAAFHQLLQVISALTAAGKKRQKANEQAEAGRIKAAAFEGLKGQSSSQTGGDYLGENEVPLECKVNANRLKAEVGQIHPKSETTPTFRCDWWEMVCGSTNLFEAWDVPGLLSWKGFQCDAIEKDLRSGKGTQRAFGHLGAQMLGRV